MSEIMNLFLSSRVIYKWSFIISQPIYNNLFHSQVYPTFPYSVSWTASCSVSATHTACESTACTTCTAETLTITAAPTRPSWKVRTHTGVYDIGRWVVPSADVSHVSVSVLVEFARLIQIMWTLSSSEVVSPFEFKTQIQRYAPRFVGYK